MTGRPYNNNVNEETIMADLLAMSSDIIDGRVAPNELGPLNRINHQLSELANDLAVVEAFSHCIVFKTDDGLVTFDTSNEHGGKKCVSAIQSWTHDRCLYAWTY
jgi:hypothetical protein